MLLNVICIVFKIWIHTAFFYLTFQVEGMNSLVSELAVVVAQEKALLDECEALLASTAAMQVNIGDCYYFFTRI